METLFESKIIYIYNKLPETISFLQWKKFLGSGDEGEVYLVQSNLNHNYALKIYKKYLRDARDVISVHNILKQIGAEPELYIVGEVDNSVITLTDVYDITLRDYLKVHPEFKEVFYLKCKKILNKLISLGYFDFDFKLDNVMLDGQRLVLIDPNIDSVDNDPEEVQKFLVYLPKIFNLETIADDAKDQYVRLTNKVYAYYLVKMTGESSMERDSQGNRILVYPTFERRAELVSSADKQNEAEIFPTLAKLRVGRKYWFSVYDRSFGYDNLVFLSKEDAVNEFLDMHFEEVIDIIRKKYENFRDDEFRGIDDPAFLDFLEEQHLLLDLSREGFKEYLMENGFLNLDPMGDDPDDYHVFQVFEVMIEA